MLERLLACQRAQVIVTPIAEDFVEEWEAALGATLPLPDELRLIRACVAAGVMTLAAGPLVNYIDSCRLTGVAPAPETIVETIIHGWSLSRRIDPKPCHCLARQTPSLA